MVRWILELYRVFPRQWVTLQEVYRCTIDHELLAKKIAEAGVWAAKVDRAAITLPNKTLYKQREALKQWTWKTEGKQVTTNFDPQLQDRLTELGLEFSVEWNEDGAGSELRQRVEAIRRWYEHDWMALDLKLRSSITEGISVFLSIFDLPEIAAVFCPPPPEEEETGPEIPPQATTASTVQVRRPLPPLDQLIETGKVLCLNMPAGANPALARSIGVMLKNAWLQALMRRPAQMQRYPNRYFRPALFLCDEYQSFASVGEDDPSGDEKAFALTRQCKCIPIVATQSISSLRSAIHGGEAWRTLLQTLRTKLFLSLSDDASARIASELCGSVARMKASYSFSENTGRSGVSLLSARAGGSQGSLGASKSYREQREPIFHPRDFALLSNCQAVCLPYDGVQSLPARRVYLKPHYLSRETPYWRLLEAGKL